MGVCGEIEESKLGLTLPHEHLFTDLRCYWDAEEYVKDVSNYSQKITAECMPKVTQTPWAFIDNLVLNDVESAITEVLEFKTAGGKTIVDASPCSAMGRRPSDLRKVSEITGANVIMASGRYTEPSMDDPEKSLSVEVLESRFIDEFMNGIDDSGIKPGFLKVGFVSSIDKVSEIRSLRAAGRVQRSLGCALAVHPHIWQPDSHKILDILEEEGCDIHKVILCHQDFLGDQLEYLDTLIQRGCFLEFDTFGTGWINDPMWNSTEDRKVQNVVNQVKMGNMDHILISGDMCMKIMLSLWGGVGLKNIPANVIPAFLERGIHLEMINQILVENPASVFCH